MIKKNQKLNIKNQSDKKLEAITGSSPSPKPQIKEPRSVTVKARYLKISFQKLNLLAKIIRRQRLLDAEKTVNFKSSKAARLLGILLKSGRAAASQRGLNLSNLWVAELLAQQGPSLKRGQAVARGSFHPIRKKTAHLVLRLQENYGTEG